VRDAAVSDAADPASDAAGSVLEQVREGGLLLPSRPIVAMLSGGRDSVCLLDLAAQLCGAEAVTALHLNYGLRPDADEDERYCIALCERLCVALEVERARGEGDDEPIRGNVQAWARDIRYASAQRIAERQDALIAVGHTASDQVETILYRLAASPGRRALLGMSAREGRVIRPLLSITREQTAAYCRSRGLSWREDESNLSDRYARNRVRHRLVPALGAVHPAAEANVLRTAQLLRQETELLDGLVDLELEGEQSIAIERLAALPPALARLVVVRLAERAGEALVPQAGDRVAELVALGRRGGRAELHLGGLIGAVIERGRLSMVKLPPRADRAR
jgi:tRNA(Ile)-lysidine synthase